MNDFQQLVYARLQSLPQGCTMSIGDADTITKEDALEHVKSNDEIGQIIIQINRNYFDMLKSGNIYEDLDD